MYTPATAPWAAPPAHASSQPGDLHDHVEVGRPFTRIDSLERSHVRVVAPHTDADVLLVDFGVIGGVVIPPAARPGLDPGVALAVDGVADRRLVPGVQVARDVSRRNAHG